MPRGLLLDVDGLTVAYGDRIVLHDVRLSVARGRRLAVIGESGSGKSTLAAALLGALPGAARVVAGSVVLDGSEVVGASEATLRSLRGRIVASVAQDPLGNLDPLRRIGSQVEESLTAHHIGGGRSERRGRVVEALRRAGLAAAERIVREYPHRLSGGMRQRALIAAALVGGAPLLVADEPTSALDVSVQKTILDHIDGLVADSGLAVLLVTHDLGVVADHADDVVVLRDGRIVETGTVGEVLRDPKDAYTRELVAAGRPDVGSPESRARVQGRAVPAVPLLELRSVTRTYPGAAQPAVDGVSLTLHRGTTLALVGESGSGKSTLAALALGLADPDAGAVLVDGEPVDARAFRRDRRLRARVQAVFQDPVDSLDPLRTVEQALTAPLRATGVAADDRTGRAREAVRRVGLSEAVLARRTGELSGGQAQRVAIARALLLQPEILVCDEAVASLDAVVRASILDLLVEVQRETGVALLFITHDLDTARRLADVVVVLRSGTVVEEGPAEGVLNNPADPYTRALVDAVPGRTFPFPASL